MAEKTLEERVEAIEKALTENKLAISITPILVTNTLSLDLSEAFQKAGISYKVGLSPVAEELEETPVESPPKKRVKKRKKAEPKTE